MFSKIECTLRILHRVAHTLKWRGKPDTRGISPPPPTITGKHLEDIIRKCGLQAATQKKNLMLYWFEKSVRLTLLGTYFKYLVTFIFPRKKGYFIGPLIVPPEGVIDLKMSCAWVVLDRGRCEVEFLLGRLTHTKIWPASQPWHPLVCRVRLAERDSLAWDTMVPTFLEGPRISSMVIRSAIVTRPWVGQTMDTAIRRDRSLTRLVLNLTSA